jgi:hypothetical protein
MIEAKFSNTRNYRQDHTEAQEFCAHFNNLLTKIDDILKDPFNFTYEAIKCLKDAVQLRGEEMKAEIDAQMDRLHTKLEEYNQECKMGLRKEEYLAKSGEVHLKNEEGRKVLEKWEEVLADELKKSEWSKVNNESAIAIEQFETSLEQFKRDLLLKNFGEYRDEIRRFFGKFEINPIVNLGYK